MKKIIITILLTTIVLTGCQNKNPELEKLKSYLENSKFYNCKKVTCEKEETAGTTKKVYNYDFESNIHTINIILGQNNTTKYEYNWKTDKTTVTYTNIDITINATYNFFNNEYTCSSKSQSDSYINSECEKIKATIEEERNKIIQDFNNSGSKYHIAE